MKNLQFSFMLFNIILDRLYGGYFFSFDILAINLDTARYLFCLEINKENKNRKPTLDVWILFYHLIKNKKL